MARPITILGQPSSLGGYAQGEEQAPAALRAAGLVTALTRAGLEVSDGGDGEFAPWHPDRDYPRAQNLFAVVRVVEETARRVSAVLGAERFALVLGGDCTVGIGTIKAAAARGRLGLLYFDLHADLNTPHSVPDGALDWMGMAHVLALPGSEPGLRDVGAKTPLLEPADVVFLAHDDRRATAWEREQITRLGLRLISVRQVAADPAAAAAAALAGFTHTYAQLIIHVAADETALPRLIAGVARALAEGNTAS